MAKVVNLSPLARKLAPPQSKKPPTKLNADGQPVTAGNVKAIYNPLSIFNTK